VTNLEFRNGVVIDDPLGHALAFLQNDYSYRSYDVLPIARDATVSLDDIRAANRIGARMSAAESEALFARRERFEAALSEIPPDSSLCNLADTIPWAALRDLYAAGAGVHGIGLAKLTKFLHKKRTELIPMLDSVVAGYLQAVGDVPRHGEPGEVATALTRGYKVDLDHNLETIRAVQRQLAERGYVLSECRILDLFTWAYTGATDPPWAPRKESSPIEVHPPVLPPTPRVTTPAAVLLGPRFEAALAYAAGVHREHVRKGTSIPYMAHVLAVTALVLEDGGGEDEAIAALLHDAVEDGGGAPRLTDIRREFGDRVARIVEECSDTDETPKPPWRERKEAYVAHLETASAEAVRVSLADKLHNARAIVGDYRQMGDALWARFNPDADQLWYYRSLLEVFRRRSASPHVRELAVTVSSLASMIASAQEASRPHSQPQI
jgi:hypothetical protein